MNTLTVLAIALCALVALAATYVIPWLMRPRDDDAIGTHEEWTGGDPSHWKGGDHG
ncbi:MAG: hypothetical protein Q8M31_12440 [Beijerinckiaceae bacterium]|nr:hypothetical protein [Beijerinckiaceae bacterium]MDP2356854.1 hypothetical protein [Beijerinckiaceae bacterium]